MPGNNEPYRVWQMHAPGDDRDDNSYAEDANGVSENSAHVLIVAQLNHLHDHYSAALPSPSRRAQVKRQRPAAQQRGPCATVRIWECG